MPLFAPVMKAQLPACDGMSASVHLLILSLFLWINPTLLIVLFKRPFWCAIEHTFTELNGFVPVWCAGRAM
jgi:hypothetical protein